MCSQNLKNSYQVIDMNESENMSLQEESQENYSSTPQENSSVESDEPMSEDPSLSEEEHPDLHDSQHSKKRESKEGFTTQFEAFKKAFDEQADQEIKLQLAVDFMEASLAQGGTPHFRSFWEARRLCLPLFKENIAPTQRSQLWHKYSELSKEARRLKEILDEQSAFAVEQIEIAVHALEQDIEHFQEQAEKAAFSENIPFPQVLKKHYSLYDELQRQLNVLNVQASRINALRKELIRTEMRVRQKNKFFQRLSAAGDRVFPKRKELIKRISQQFVEDIDHFIKAHFSSQESHESLYVLREEIKSLQSLAKILTLNTNSFTQTRTRLSECWDHIKVEEKERKKERAQQKVIFRQNAEEIQQQIQNLKENVENKAESAGEAQRKIEGIVALMRKTELGRDELKSLREALSEVRKSVQDQTKLEEEARQQQEQERNRQKQEKYNQLKDQTEKLLQHYDTLEVEALVSRRDELVTHIHDSNLTKNEKQELERLLKPLRDIITEKKEKALLDLSEDDRQALLQLKEILNQRRERRQEIKNQLEILRKAAGSSSLDFEKAISYTNQINEEKERLEKAQQGIQEIERKIADLQTKLKK